jgi:clan AA aspartic protease (TIGR02281 family)
MMISLYRNEKEYGTALQTVNLAIKANPKKSEVSDAVLYWWRSAVYEDMGDNVKAAADMERAAKMAKKGKDQSWRDIMTAYAQMKYDSTDYTGADAVYMQILKEDETDQLAMVGMARNSIGRKDYKHAVEILEKCKAYDSEYYEIYRFLMQAHNKLGAGKDAVNAAVKYLEYSDDPVDEVWDVLQDNYAYAVAKIKEMSRQSSGYGSAWNYFLAKLHEEAGKYEMAVQAYSILLEEYGYDAELMMDRSNCYDALGCSELAIQDMNEVISKEKENLYFYDARACHYRFAGMYAEAIEDFSKVIELYPTSAYGYYNRGWCYELSGDDKSAMENYDAGLEIDQSYSYLFLMRGELRLKLGNRERAMEDFEMVVKLDTSLTDGSCRHYALHFLGKDDEAREWMDKLIAEDPDDSGNYYDKACLYSRMGKLDEAVNALRSAFENGYRRFPHIENDDDLDPIRELPAFIDLMNEYKAKHEAFISKYMKEKTPENAEEQISEVEMKKMYSGTYEIPCQVNGLPLKMVFDTGASDVTISAVEANFMLKNGYLSDDDIKGKSQYMTASGDIHEGTVLRLKEVQLGDTILKNIEASVVHSQKAPLLLGQSVLEKFGTITIDNVNSKLVIKR